MYGQLCTREELLQQAANSPFSESRIEVEDVLIDGDRVAVRVTGYHTLAATEKETIVTGMIIAVIKDGQLMEGWGQHDRLGQLQQLGVIPEGEELRRLVQEKLAGPGGSGSDRPE
jgi:hypothetical protein